MKDLVNDHAGGAAEWQSPREHLIQDNAQAVNVRPPVDLMAPSRCLLWTHKGGSTKDLALDGHSRFTASFPLGHSKVHDKRRTVGSHHYIGRLHVAMDDSSFVG